MRACFSNVAHARALPVLVLLLVLVLVLVLVLMLMLVLVAGSGSARVAPLVRSQCSHITHVFNLLANATSVMISGYERYTCIIDDRKGERVFCASANTLDDAGDLLFYARQRRRLIEAALRHRAR